MNVSQGTRSPSLSVFCPFFTVPENPRALSAQRCFHAVLSTVMGQVVRSFFPEEPVWAMLIAAGVMTLAALAMLRVRRSAPEESFQ